MISTLFSMAQTVPNVQWINHYSTQSSVLGLPTVPAAIDVDRNVYVAGYAVKAGSGLDYYSNQRGLKMYLVIKPGANPQQIQIQFNGADHTAIEAGMLNIYAFGNRKMSYRNPIAYQLTPMLTPVPISGGATWISMGANTYRIQLGTYNPALPLIIQIDQGLNPALLHTDNMQYSTYIGGMNEDVFYDVDGYKGTSYISNYAGICAVGYTLSTPFAPLGNTPNGSLSGLGDMFIIGFNNDYLNLWVTFKGRSSGINKAYDAHFINNTHILVSGYLTGNTGELQNGYIAKISAASGIITHEYEITHNKADYITRVCSNGNDIYACGYREDANGISPISGTDGFVIKLDSSLNVVTPLTFFGNEGEDILNSVVFDSINNTVWVVGTTNSVTIPAVFGGLNGIKNAVYAQLNPVTLTTINGGYFGTDDGLGGNITQGTDIVIDIYSGAKTIGGYTNSSALPNTYIATHGSYHYKGGYDGFIHRLTGTKLTMYQGGSSDDYLYKMHIYRNENVIPNQSRIYFTGKSTSTDFALATPMGHPHVYISLYKGNTDVYLAEIGNDISDKYYNIWSTYFGGINTDIGYGITTTLNNKMIMVGTTNTTNTSFPLRKFNTDVYYQNVLNLGNTTDCFDGWFAGFLDHELIPNIKNEDKKIENTIILYPNPTNGIIEGIYHGVIHRIQVIDVLGHVMLEHNQVIQSGVSFMLNFSGLSSGMYHVRFLTQSGYIFHKIIKQ